MSMKLDAYLGVHVQALKLRSQRTEVLAAKLANADTPSYRARDIDREAAGRLWNEADDGRRAVLRDRDRARFRGLSYTTVH